MIHYKSRRSIWPYVAGGFVVGVVCGMLYEAWEMSREPEHSAPKKPSFASRMLARIPKRVKLRAAIGAATEGSKEAARELRQKLTRRQQ